MGSANRALDTGLPHLLGSTPVVPPAGTKPSTPCDGSTTLVSTGSQAKRRPPVDSPLGEARLYLKPWQLPRPTHI